LETGNGERHWMVICWSANSSSELAAILFKSSFGFKKVQGRASQKIQNALHASLQVKHRARLVVDENTTTNAGPNFAFEGLTKDRCTINLSVDDSRKTLVQFGPPQSLPIDLDSSTVEVCVE